MYSTAITLDAITCRDALGDKSMNIPQLLHSVLWAGLGIWARRVATLLTNL